MGFPTSPDKGSVVCFVVSYGLGAATKSKAPRKCRSKVVMGGEGLAAAKKQFCGGGVSTIVGICASLHYSIIMLVPPKMRAVMSLFWPFWMCSCGMSRSCRLFSVWPCHKLGILATWLDLWPRNASYGVLSSLFIIV